HNPAADEAIVRKALDRLGKAHLLQEAVPRTAGMTRRQALGKFGRAAALSLVVPVVRSITAPTLLWAAHRKAKLEFLCDAPACISGCKDQCRGDRDCPKNNPLCRLLSCGDAHCGSCMQRRCTRVKSPHSFDIIPL